ncbi:acid-sensing ion channel 1C-like [Macrobrachium rosenbergii]|uniref:acid-sensing ion channel 1C-like n=1 Tax=Macrobrachium rosenbergii TaxID=79674 RepID=UPI0034D45A6B
MSQRSQSNNIYDPVLPRRAFMAAHHSTGIDENPPSYETMYPEVFDQGAVSTEQPRTSVALQPTELLRALEASKESDKKSERAAKPGSSKNTESGITHCQKGGQVKNETKGSFLEHRLTFSEFSKSTRKRIINQAAGLKENSSAALREFCQTTSAHGFSHVITPDLHIAFKAFWFIITFVSLCLLGVMTYQETKEAFFIRSPTTEIRYKDNRAHGLYLPHLTVCSLSGFLKSKLEEYSVSSTLASYILISVRGQTIISSSLATNPRLFLNLKTQLTEYLAQNNVTLSELIIKLSPRCEEVIGFCYAADKLYPNNVCCDKLFSTVITSNGVCYTTIGAKGMRITQALSGINGGLKVVFPIKDHEYVEYSSNVVFIPWLSEEGVQVSMSDYSMTASTAVVINSIRIAPNMAATVALSLDTVDHTERYASVWPWPKKDPQCVNREAYLKKTEEEAAYTENNLYTTLKNRNCSLELSNCTAIPSRLPNDTTAECTPHDILEQYFNGSLQECVSRKVQEYDIGDKMFCVTNTYIQQLSYTTLCNRSITELQSSGIISTDSLSMVTIFYSQLQYNELLERTPGFLTWFSSLGGQMGLFLGASFITLVELVFVVLYIVRVSVFRAFKILYYQAKRSFSAEIESGQT